MGKKDRSDDSPIRKDIHRQKRMVAKVSRVAKKIAKKTAKRGHRGKPGIPKRAGKRAGRLAEKIKKQGIKVIDMPGRK